MAGLCRNVMYVPGALRKDEKEDSTSAPNIWGRLKSYKCQRPSLLRVTAIAIAVGTLVGVIQGILYLTSTENKHAETAEPSVKVSPSLPGVISTDKTDTSNKKETALLTTEGHLSSARPLPVDDATHGPRCKKGYRLLAGTCIKLVSTGWFGLGGKSHYDAKKICKKEGATLAMPKTEELDVALRDLVKTEGGNKGHWIGMEEKDGTWYWVDGSLVGQNGYKGWNTDQPIDSSWPFLCGQYWEKVLTWVFSQSGHPMWDTGACFNLKSFICQRPPV